MRGFSVYLPVRSGSDQMPWWPGLTIDPNLKSSPDVSPGARAPSETSARPPLQGRGFEQEGAVQQRVVLQADAPAVGEERLVVLVVVVQVVLGPQHGLDHGHRAATVGLHRH